jgi:hypothetical protein
MVFRNNIIFFWLVVLALGIATIKSFTGSVSTVILAMLSALLIVDGALSIGHVRATCFFLKRHRPKP